MRPSFNLIEEPWIPCVRTDDTIVEYGLREVLARSHEVREVVGDSPLETAALLRLLLVILHRVFGPADPETWAKLYEVGRWDMEALDTYFGRWKERFDLFHPERPFYQAKAEHMKEMSISKLVHGYDSLFEHGAIGGGLSLTVPQAARYLVSDQAYAFGGTNNPPPHFPNFVGGPAARLVSFYAIGDNLFRTLTLNLWPYPDEGLRLGNAPTDCPVWESSERAVVLEREVPIGLLDYLTWVTRFVWLIPETTPDGTFVSKILVNTGRRISPQTFDPTALYWLDKEYGARFLRFSETRALWRDSTALFAPRMAEGTQSVVPPRVFDWLAELVVSEYLDRHDTLRYLAIGMCSKPGQDLVYFWRTETMPLPLSLVQDIDLADRLQAAVMQAELVAKVLDRALTKLAGIVLVEDSDDPGTSKRLSRDQLKLARDMARQWGAEAHYWSTLETPFRRMVEAIPTDPGDATGEWRRTVRRTALGALDRLIASLDTSPRTLKAGVRASRSLAYALSQFESTGEVLEPKKGNKSRGNRT